MKMSIGIATNSYDDDLTVNSLFIYHTNTVTFVEIIK